MLFSFLSIKLIWYRAIGIKSFKNETICNKNDNSQHFMKLNFLDK